MKIIRRIKFKSDLLYRKLTAGERILPSFLIIGAAKCGTTSLYNYLIQHPGILPSFKKEVHYFDYYFHKGVNWYRSHFPLKKEVEQLASQIGHKVITGESSPYYLAHPLAAGRVKELLPDVKLICMLRNPADRAISSYFNQRRLGIETLPSFEEAIEQEEKRIAGHEEKLREDPSYSSFEHKYFSYVRRGCYADQLENWYAEFPKSQILVIQSEEFYSNPSPVYREVIKFLELPEWEPKQYKVFNAGGEYGKMDPDTREKLIRFYRPHNEKLFALTGRRYNWDN